MTDDIFKRITESLPDIVWVTDQNGVPIYFNKRWYEFTGQKVKDSLVFQQSPTMVHPDDFDKTITTWKKAIAQKKEYLVEHRFKDYKSGGYRWFLSRGVPVKDPQGTVVSWFGTTTDIDLQKKAVEAVAESEERFRSLADNAPVLIWLCDTNKQCTYFNKAWLEFTGRTLKQELKDGWQFDIHPDDLERSLEIFDKAFLKHEKFTKEYRLKRADGEYRWMMDIGVPRFTSSGTFSGYIGSCVDITERRELEKRKDEFISIASHELKTPLTSLKGYTQVLKQQPNLDKTILYYLSKMELQLDRLTDLINDLLDVSRIHAGKLELHSDKLRISDLVADVVEDMQRLDLKHQIIFEGQTGKTVRADRYRIQQVLVNLISNAIKYSPKANQINVSVKEVDGKIRVSVQDFGIGISKKELDKIFSRFYQANNKIRQSFAGLGLGLYISSEIINRHKGRIWVESEKGKGSIFSFELPAK